MVRVNHRFCIPKGYYVILKVLVCVLAFYMVFRKLNFRQLLSYMEDANIILLIMAVGFSSISLIISAIRSQYYFEQYGLALSTKFSIALYYMGTFYNILLPGGIGGDGYKVYLLSKLEKFSKILSLRIILYERVNGFYILMCLGLILLLFSNFVAIQDFWYLKWLVVCATISITPCYLLGAKYILRDKITTALRASYYSFFVQIFQIMMFLSIFIALSPRHDAGLIIDFSVLFIIASIIAILPISIGGAGLRELTFFYGLDLMHPSLQSLGVAVALVIFVVGIISSLPGMFFSFSHSKPRM